MTTVTEFRNYRWKKQVSFETLPNLIYQQIIEIFKGDLKTGRQAHSTVVLGSNIMVIGGSNEPNT